MKEKTIQKIQIIPFGNMEVLMKFPCGDSGYEMKPGHSIYHPNQHGYKVMFDDITNNHVDINFKINVDTN